MFRTIGERIDRIIRLGTHLFFGMVIGLFSLFILLYFTGKIDTLLGLVFPDRLN